jgi:hypothetical protein
MDLYAAQLRHDVEIASLTSQHSKHMLPFGIGERSDILFRFFQTEKVNLPPVVASDYHVKNM